MKCAGCKISVHVTCMEQLEKVKPPLLAAPRPPPASRSPLSPQINFRCKPSFREPACRAVREVSSKHGRLSVRGAHNSLTLRFRPTWCDITGSTGGGRRGSVGSAGRWVLSPGPVAGPEGTGTRVQGECFLLLMLTGSKRCRLQGFQQKFAFHSKEIVAISCSWCKQAVSLSVSKISAEARSTDKQA